MVLDHRHRAGDGEGERAVMERGVGGDGEVEV